MIRLFALTCVFVVSSSAFALADTVGALRGSVQENGHGVEHVTVHLTGDHLAQSTTTNDTGHFAFARVPFGHYTLTATLDKTLLSAQVDVATDTIVDVTLEPLATIGRVSASTRTVHGTPVSESALTSNTIAVLPENDSLNQLIETVPGIVRFSYNEPVAHGFHGLTYELDGVPLPQSTSANFSELIDPRSIDALEIFTGAFPAEYGGSRQGAVVNVISTRPESGPTSPNGQLTLGAGSYGTADARISENFSLGPTSFTVAANESRTNRGIDAPTPDATLTNDQSNLSDQFLRIVHAMGTQNTLAFDVSNQFAGFQIPIDTNPNDPNDPNFSLPGTNDTQLEFNQLASLAFTHTSTDGLGTLQIVPWVRTTRTEYLGDLQEDILSTSGVGLSEDRRAAYAGLRANFTRASALHDFKIGIDASRESFSSSDDYLLGENAAVANGGTLPPGVSSVSLANNVAQAGTFLGIYAQDRWILGSQYSLNYGLRYDHSTGFVGGSQLSPRIEFNYAPEASTIFHAYFGRLYAAPQLEDVRQDFALISNALGMTTTTPVYDLKPEQDSYVEFGLEHTFHPGFTLWANAWQRNVTNVLDTTQLLDTPLFAVFNNSIGHAHGLELRVNDTTLRDDFFVSASLSQSLAGGISGSTFLFPPDQISDDTLQPEDHDQAVAINASYTHRFTPDRSYYATLSPQYGTGYPVQFQNGEGRLPSHLTFDSALGRLPDAHLHRIGYQLVTENLFNLQYLIKVNNGFNTTQYAQGRKIVFRIIVPT